MGLLNTALSVIQIGPGLVLNGSVLSTVGSSSTRLTTSYSTSQALTNQFYYVGYTGSGGSTFTMPDATVNGGLELVIKNRGSGSLLLDATTFGGFWGTSLVNTWTLVVGEAVHVISDGTNWVIVSFASGVIT